ncbi:hypothetical protein BDZ97DRAFT_1794503 [Flammula alnicola]|nr:hypothetical protein BDZ97DRAFT_1794503 [Flammula alnicola]
MEKSDRKVSFGQSPTVEALSAGYYQYSGQGPGKVEEEVCLLDSSAASRRQGNCEGTLGRERSHPSSKRMGSESGTAGGGGSADGQAELAPSFFYHLSPDLLPYGWEPYGIYERADLDVLGVEVGLSENGGDSESTDRSRCFNCGDPDHKVTECRFRLNRELIALARQYYQFHQGSLGLGNWQRIHAVEAWRQQRLHWLEDEYGNEDEWLKNISVWGYPRGWVSETDPRDRVRARIWNENEGDVDDELDGDALFEIHGTVILSSNSQSTNSSYRSPSSTNGVPIRWAHYPSSYFSSQHLVLYVPPTRREPWSSTLFENTDAYLHQFYNAQQPPPPPDEPPPLPPSSPPPPLPPLPFLVTAASSDATGALSWT